MSRLGRLLSLLTLALACLSLALSGCGGGGGLAEGGTARRPGAGYLAVELRFTEGPPRLLGIRENTVQLAMPESVTLLVIDVLEIEEPGEEEEEEKVVPTTVVPVGGRTGDIVVDIRPVPAGRHNLRILALDDAGRIVVGYLEPVVVLADQTTDVVATLTPWTSPTPSPSPTVIANPRFLYGSARTGGSVTGYAYDGASTFSSPDTWLTSGLQPRALAVGPGRTVLFVACENSGGAAGRTTLESFLVHPDTGVLTPVSVVTLGNGELPSGLACHPDDGLPILYVAMRGAGAVKGFQYNGSTGQLLPAPVTSVAVPGALDVSIPESGNYALATSGSPAQVQPLALDGNGLLSVVEPAFPIAAGPPARSLILRSSPDRLYTSIRSAGSPQVLVHDLDPDTGALGNQQSFALAGPATEPVGLALHPSRTRLYVGCSPGRVATFDVDGGTGALTNQRQVATTPATSVEGLSADRDGRSLYAAVNRGTAVAGLLEVFTLNASTGTPTSLTTRALGAEALDVVATDPP